MRDSRRFESASVTQSLTALSVLVDWAMCGVGADLVLWSLNRAQRRVSKNGAYEDISPVFGRLLTSYGLMMTFRSPLKGCLRAICCLFVAQRSLLACLRGHQAHFPPGSGQKPGPTLEWHTCQ